MSKIFLFFLVFLNPFLSYSQNVFDIGVRTIEIFFNEPNWDDSLHIYYANNSGERLIADSVVIDGLVDQDVGIKYKGNSSYSPNNLKNPLNIKLDYINNGQSIDGYNVLKLSNGFRDPSFIREVLSYEIARNYMPAPKATYANVFVDGVLIGLYTCVQSIDDDFTNEHFYERKGPFFKVENTGVSVPGCLGQLGILEYYSDTNCYQRAYEMQSSNDWEKLGDFLDTLNNNFSEIENVLDIDRALWMMAFENLIVALDGPINSVPHNFYLFKDNNGRFSPIIWDMNMSFGSFTGGFAQPNNQQLQELDAFHNMTDVNNKLLYQIFSSDSYKRMYLAHMRTILEEYFINGNYITRANELQQLISSDIISDPNLFYSYSDFLDALSFSVGTNPVIGISELMDSRIQYLQNYFSTVPPNITPLNTNSVSTYSTVNITAQISDVNYAYVGYRFKFSDKFEKIQMLDDGLHGDGAAGDGVFGVTINVDARDIQYYFYAENNEAGIFSPQRAEKEFHQLTVIGGLVINEIMAGNSSAVSDQDGEYDDWVELYNGGQNSINLQGFYLSDNENNLTKYSFPNVSIPSNGYLIIWCDSAGNTQQGLHTTFRLSADQEEVYLSDPSATPIDAVHFVNMPTDISYSRIPNGTGAMQYNNHTYGANNQPVSNTFNFSSEIRLRAYPNPSNTRVYILGSSKTVNVLNLMGQKIFSGTDIKDIDISSWDSGIYFIESGNDIIKILKQ